MDSEAVGSLYAEPPDQFVTARNELVARLKDARDQDGAKMAAALRKPTVAAWAVDSIARDHARDLEDLIEVGNDLASAQRQAAVGGGVERLHESADRRRQLVDRLTRASADDLESAGMSATRATLEKVSDTLMAIATDREAAERVRRGVLEKELPAPAGFGDERLDTALLASVSELPRRSNAESPDASATRRSRRKEQEAKKRADRLAAEALKLEEEADRLEKEAKQAEVRAASAGKTATEARRRAEATRRRADQAAD